MQPTEEPFSKQRLLKDLRKGRMVVDRALCGSYGVHCLFFVFVFIQVIHFAFFSERIVPQLLARDYAL